MKNRSAVFYRDLRSAPPSIIRGKGVYLEDDAGRRYLDGSANASVVGIGHGRTEIWDALAREGEGVTFVYNANFTHPWQERLASAILAKAPANMGAVYFTSGGSEANESAWKLARQYFVERGQAEKYKAIARWQSYHGVTLAMLSLSGRTAWRRIYSPMLPAMPHVAPPYEYRCAFCAGQEGCTLACADDLERVILQEGPETVAAFFAEPISGTSLPGLAPTAAYLGRVRDICDRYDVLFVADEVLCGYGRTGTAFAVEQFDVEPDIVTLGKALASGYAPLAAMLVSERIRESLADGSGRFVHGLTYSGMPSACFIGLRVHEIMEREGLFTRAAEIGAYLRGKLAALSDKHEIIGESRGRGLLHGLEFVADRATRRPFRAEACVAESIVGHMREQGVIIAPGAAFPNFGKGGDQIQISPPFIISEAEIDELVAALDCSIAAVAGMVV